jgi:septum formation topological specificity factor MinE
LHYVGGHTWNLRDKYAVKGRVSQSSSHEQYCYQSEKLTLVPGEDRNSNLDNQSLVERKRNILEIIVQFSTIS